MSIDLICACISARLPKVRTGVDIGFSDVAVCERLRSAFRALWMTVTTGDAASMAASTRLAPNTVFRIGVDGTLPFDDNQFEIAVLNGEILAQPIVREIHRILKPAGRLVFTIEESVRRGPDNTLGKLYNDFLKCGFDIASADRPPWWRLGRDGRALTVVARKKNWHEPHRLNIGRLEL